MFESWIFSLIANSAGAALLLGVVGWFGRTQISHWLNKDLETVKAGYQRELESYKVSLIAEAERAKASRDIQKAMAIRIAEKKFSAIDTLHRELRSKATLVVSTVVVYAPLNAASRAQKAAELVGLVHKASEAQSLADFFLTSPEQLAISEFLADLAQVAGKLGEPNFSIQGGDIESIKKSLTQRQLACDAIVDAHIAKMLSMD